MDFGSGEGITANYYAKDNEVVAVESWSGMLQNRWLCFLDDFEKAHDLLDGKDSAASKVGVIRYYEDDCILVWAPYLLFVKVKE